MSQVGLLSLPGAGRGRVRSYAGLGGLIGRFPGHELDYRNEAD